MIPSRLLRTGALLLGAMLTLTGQAQPAAPGTAMTPATDPIEGVWTGTVTAPQGEAAEIGFEFGRTQRGTLALKVVHFPEMFTYAHPFVIPLEREGAAGYRITPAFNIVMQLEGDVITGTFAPGKLPLRLRRGGTFGAQPPAPAYPAAPAPLWSFALGAGTWAPPVAADGVVYVGTSAGRFHAVHTADGTARWSWQGEHGIDGRAVPTDDTVLVVDVKNNLLALDRATGALRWLTPLHDEVVAGAPAPDNPTFNHRAATPLVIGGTVYVGSSDRGLYALDARTGAKLWRHDAGAPVFSGIGRRGEAGLVFGTMDGSVVFLDRHTRKETQRFKTGGGVVTTPVISAGRLVVGSRDYLLHGFNLDGREAWRYAYWFSWIESTPVERDGLLYVGASDYSRVVALDPATGRARWATKVHGMNWGSPLVTADRVFTGTASQNIGGTIIPHEGGLVAIDRATGRVLWRHVAPAAPEGGFGGYAGTLALDGGKVIAAGFDGRLVAFPAN